MGITFPLEGLSFFCALGKLLLNFHGMMGKIMV